MKYTETLWALVDKKGRYVQYGGPLWRRPKHDVLFTSRRECLDSNIFGDGDHAVKVKATYEVVV